jgi:hypothetical protein
VTHIFDALRPETRNRWQVSISKNRHVCLQVISCFPSGLPPAGTQLDGLPGKHPCLLSPFHSLAEGERMKGGEVLRLHGSHSVVAPTGTSPAEAFFPGKTFHRQLTAASETTDVDQLRI